MVLNNLVGWLNMLIRYARFANCSTSLVVQILAEHAG